MSVVQLAGITVTESAYKRARAIAENNENSGRRTAASVLESIRAMKPGWNVYDNENGNWGEGFRNIEIAPSVLRRMAENDDALIRYKALILDLEEVLPTLQEWAEENEGLTLEFGVNLNANGETTAQAVVRTLMGGEMRSTFELPGQQSTWAELIRMKLDAINESRNQHEEEGSGSWLA